MNMNINQKTTLQKMNLSKKVEIGLDPRSPYSAAVRSNIGRDFFNLVTKCFPKGHPLRKIFNRNTIKIVNSCTQNIESIISCKNKKLLAPQQPDERQCSCTKNNPCLLGGQCLRKNIIYKATVTLEDQ